MSDNDYKSHRHSEGRTPIIKSLYDRIKIDGSKDDITGYKEAKKDNILLHPRRLENRGIIYPYLLTDSLSGLNNNRMNMKYYMAYYRSSFEFLDISGAYPVRIDYTALTKYMNYLKSTRGSQGVRLVNRKFMNEGGDEIYTVGDKDNFLEYKFNFMSGTENRSSVGKTRLVNKYNLWAEGPDAKLGYLYLTKEDVVKLFEMKKPWINEEIGELEGGHSYYADCGLCDGDGDILCECDNGQISCHECEEGYRGCGECGGGGYGTCGLCDGEGMLECPYCEGRGQGGDYGTCGLCDGSGEIEEPCPNCEGGKVECGECDATGKNDEDEECVECDGTGEIDCETCDGENEITKTCEICDGSGEIGCGWCDVEGMIDCEDCGGGGEVEGGCEYCDDGRVECDECGGHAEIECPVCEAHEYVRCVFAYEEEDNNLNSEEKGFQTQEPFSAYFDWKLKEGEIHPERDVYWIVEDIDFNNWYGADISQVKYLLRGWNDDDLYGGEHEMFVKLSNFNISYTLATPQGLIKNALRIYFVWDEKRDAFSVIRIGGEYGKVKGHRMGASYRDRKLIYYSLGGIRLVNWNSIDFNQLKS